MNQHLIVPGSRWRNTGGKHSGRVAEVIKPFNGNTVFFKYLKGTAKSWDGSTAGKPNAIGVNAFLQYFIPEHRSGGRDPHDAPLPPAALRGPIPEEREVELPTLTKETNGHAPAETEHNEHPELVVEPTPEPTKVCAMCGLLKPLGAYAKNAARNGRKDECRDCRNALRAQHIREAQKTSNSQQKMIDNAKAKVAAMSEETKAEILAARKAGLPQAEVLRAYGLNMRMLSLIVNGNTGAKDAEREAEVPTNNTGGFIREPEPVDVETGKITWTPIESTATKVPVSTARNKVFTVEFTVTRTVTERVIAANMTEALAKVLREPGVAEVHKIEAHP